MTPSSDVQVLDLDDGVPDNLAHIAASPFRDGSWLMDGAMPLERLRELLGTAAEFPGEASGAYQTLAGFVLHQLGRIPAPSDYFEWDSHRFEVVDMDPTRSTACSFRPASGAARYNTNVKQARQPLAGA